MTAPQSGRHIARSAFGTAVAALLALAARLWARLRLPIASAAWKVLVLPDDPALNQLDAATAQRFREVSGQFKQICAGKELTR